MSDHRGTPLKFSTSNIPPNRDAFQRRWFDEGRRYEVGEKAVDAIKKKLSSAKSGEYNEVAIAAFLPPPRKTPR